MKDAKSLVSLDNGERLDYFDTVRTMWVSENNDARRYKIVGNWYVFVIQIYYPRLDLLLPLGSSMSLVVF